MCGIVGFSFFNFNEGGEILLEVMYKVIYYRGLDVSGMYIDEYIGFCYRWLSIFDFLEVGN